MEYLEYLSMVWVIYSIIEFITDKFNINIDKFLCLRCWSFWLVLIYTFNPFTASIVSLMAEILDRIVLNKKIRIK